MVDNVSDFCGRHVKQNNYGFDTKPSFKCGISHHKVGSKVWEVDREMFPKVMNYD